MGIQNLNTPWRYRMGGGKLNLSVLGYGQVVGCCEHGNEPLGFIKCREMIECLKHCRFLKDDFAVWII
jgi:hypothetical protein